MNPDDPNVQAWLEPELEARLVASLLGEASAFEQAELDRLLEERPEIAVFQRRLQAVHGLVGEAVKQGPDDEWKLPKDKRTKVLESIRGTTSESGKPSNVVAQSQTRHRWIGIAAAAAVVVFAGAVATTSMMSGIDAASTADIAMARERRDSGREMDSKTDASDFEVSTNDGLESAAGTSGASFGDLAQVEHYAYQIPATPSKPRELRSRNRGVTTTVDPAAGPDDYTIDMDIAPEVVEFDGFAYYETPTPTTAPQATYDDMAILGYVKGQTEAGELALADTETEGESLGNQAGRSLGRENQAQAQQQSEASLLALADLAAPAPAPSAAPVDRFYSRNTGDTKNYFGASNAPAKVEGLTELASETIPEAITEEAPTKKRNLGKISKLAETTKKEVDVSNDLRFGMSVAEAPDVVTRSGSKAKVEVVREMVDPDEVEVPEVAEVAQVAKAGEALATAPSDAGKMLWNFRTNESLGSNVSNKKIDLPGMEFTKDESVRRDLSDTLADASSGQVGGGSAAPWGTSLEPGQTPNNSLKANLSGSFRSSEESPARGEIAQADKDFQTDEDWSEPYASLSDGDRRFGQIAGITQFEREQVAKQSAADDPFAENMDSKEVDEEEVRLAQVDSLERHRNVDFGAVQQQQGQGGLAGAEVESKDFDGPIALSIELQQAQAPLQQQLGAAVSRRTDQQWHSSGGARMDLKDPSSESLWDDMEGIESAGLTLAGKITAPQFQEDLRGLRSGDQLIEEQEIEPQLAATREKFFDVINSDSVNAAARSGLEELELKTSRSLAAARDQTPASILKGSTEEQQLAEQSDKVEEARLKMLDLAERYRIIDLAAMQNQASLTGDPVTGNGTILMSSMQDSYSAESQIAKVKMQLEKLDEEAGEQLVQSAAMLDIQDPTLQALLPLYQEAQVNEQNLTDSGLAENHPELEAAREHRAKTLSQVEEAVKSVRGTLKTKLDIATKALALAKDIEEGKKDTSMDERRKVAEYSEASKEYELQKNLLANMQAEHAKNQPPRLLKRVEAKKRAPKPLPQLNEKRAKQEPFSTFSLHVSDVAFKLAKAALLEQNTWPETEKVRIEEFVNAFDYGDPAPTQTEKVSCRIEQAAHPFRQQRNLLRVSMRTAEMGRSSGTPLQITLLLDTSGSMEREDRQESISRAMEVLTSQLTPNDTVTLIGFARQPRLIQDRLTGEALRNLPNFVQQTPSEGGTNLEEALLLGAEHARRQYDEAGQNRIVLLTDGAANLGDANAESLRSLVVGLRQEGIAFDACGVGAEGLNDTILEALTRDGDGRYYLLNKPEDADAGFARQLAGAFRPAARNVKVQVRFNDQRVGNYRLLGFEKHRLKKEDFRNDKVDAAEMASSEAGVAVYEIEPLAQGKGEIGEVSVRFQDMTTSRMVERSWTIAFDENVPALDEATPSLQLASTAAFLGEKLKKSPFGQAIDLDELSQVLTNLRQRYSSDQRVASLIAMIEKAKQY